MIDKFKIHENALYNHIISLSRNKLFYTTFYLDDTFQNRINLIFLHTSFLFIKIKQNEHKEKYKSFYQKIFDLIFLRIEQNMREIGFGDVNVNKKMKIYVKNFYNILLNCEKFNKETFNSKSSFLLNYLSIKDNKNALNSKGLVDYFDKYRTFCLDLTIDNVLKGSINFKYNY
tara:strand:- start:322 stop:840 length:519 start_codon:yes stop_codon:yes gene_type:complete